MKSALKWLLAIAAAIALGLGAGSVIAGSADETRSEEAAERPKPKVPQGPPAKELIVEDLIEGTGVTAEEGDAIRVHYVAGIYETGEEIESAWEHGNPLGFVLGGGGYLPSWEKGMQGVRVGARRMLVFPTSRAEAPPGSELGETLVYVIDVVEITDPPEGS